MHIDKKTKIVCTIGPSTQTEDKLAELLRAGMNVVRMNFSHGDFAEHQVKVDNLKKAIKKTGIPCATMQDLGGPKIRTGEFENGEIILKEGQKFTITTDKVMGNQDRVSINYANLPKEVKKGGFILIHDGKRKLEIIDIKGNDVICKVIVGGHIKSRRGVNLPGAYLSISSITEKDKADIAFGLKNKVDYFAFSFVRRPADIIELREILAKAKSSARIIAKVEDTEGLENFDKIVDLVDGVMVARGDMGIEIGAENLPLNQKMMIEKCNAKAKVVITATHMLESMIKSAVPTRAEVSDIANAIIDGTDMLMLSEETTLGDYPVHAVKVMTSVAKVIENSDRQQDRVQDLASTVIELNTDNDAIAACAVETARVAGASIIAPVSMSGEVVRKISRYKPIQPIIAFINDPVACNQAVMSYGVYPVDIDRVKNADEGIKKVKEYILKNKLAKSGEKVVITVGLPVGKAKESNSLFIETL